MDGLRPILCLALLKVRMRRRKVKASGWRIRGLRILEFLKALHAVAPVETGLVYKRQTLKELIQFFFPEPKANIMDDRKIRLVIQDLLRDGFMDRAGGNEELDFVAGKKNQLLRFTEKARRAAVH